MPLRRTIQALMGLLLLAAGFYAALHHPGGPVLAGLAMLAWTAACHLRPLAGLAMMLALLPVTGLASWTGWFVVEELDLMLAGFGAACCASGLREPVGVAPRALPDAGLPVTLLAAFGVSCVVAMFRGYWAAQGPPLQWAQGYFEPLNSVRLAKPYLWIAVLLPLLHALYRRAPASFIATLTHGMAAGLALCALAVIWERLAFTGLLNFSADYRVTGLFWEMHVGGAALDGYLAMAMPFAIRSALQAQGATVRLLTGSAAVLGGYACLVTFSRGVYLAVPVSLVVMAALSSRGGDPKRGARPLASAVMLAFFLALTAVGIWQVFDSGGYRSSAAILSLVAGAVLSGTAAHSMGVGRTASALSVGALFGLAASLASPLLPKGPYVVHGLAVATFALGLVAHRWQSDHRSAAWLIGSLGWISLSAGGIALHWGGVPAAIDSAPVVLALLLLTVTSAAMREPLWPAQARAQMLLLGATAMVAGTIAVFAGGAYMGQRFTHSAQDLAGRISHWRDGLALLDSPTEWFFGKGLGRFPANYFYRIAADRRPGTYAWVADGSGGYLALSAPNHPMSWGDFFRIAQRVPARPGGYRVSLDVRSHTDVELHVEICEKHLLYNEACGASAQPVRASPTAWRAVSIPIDAGQLTGGPWYAPRLALFSIALSTPGTRVELDNVRLDGPSGDQLLSNPGLDHGMSGWFFTSDRAHLPWHIKSLAMNLLFEQGATGLCAFVLLCAVALMRLALNRDHGESINACLAAAITGFLAVGLFDSLLDVPRVTWLFWLLVVTALMVASDAHRTLARGWRLAPS